MKKLFAILLALTLVLSFAACGSKETTEPESTEPEAVATETEAVATETEAAATATEAEAAATETEAEVTEPEAAATETEAAATETEAEEETTEEVKEFNSTDPAEVVAFYNEARKATNPAPKGHQTMVLDGDITGDGVIGALLSVLGPAAKSALEKNSKDTDWIPGHDSNDILASDVTSAKATTKDGVTTVELKFKDQVDGPNGDNKNGGAVARGVSTLGSIDNALNEMGATITEGRDSVKLTYTDAYLTAKIKDGKIIGGTWHYKVKIFVGDAKGKLGITLNLKNINATVDYKVVI